MCIRITKMDHGRVLEHCVMYKQCENDLFLSNQHGANIGGDRMDPDRTPRRRRNTKPRPFSGRRYSGMEIRPADYRHTHPFPVTRLVALSHTTSAFSTAIPSSVSSRLADRRRDKRSHFLYEFETWLLDVQNAASRSDQHPSSFYCPRNVQCLIEASLRKKRLSGYQRALSSEEYHE